MICVLMDLMEETIHSFIIRLWLEEHSEEPRRSKWRGHITHIPSNQRKNFDDLDDMKHFVASYLNHQNGSLSRQTSL